MDGRWVSGDCTAMIDAIVVYLKRSNTSNASSADLTQICFMSRSLAASHSFGSVGSPDTFVPFTTHQDTFLLFRLCTKIGASPHRQDHGRSQHELIGWRCALTGATSSGSDSKSSILTRAVLGIESGQMGSVPSIRGRLFISPHLPRFIAIEALLL